MCSSFQLALLVLEFYFKFISFSKTELKTDNDLILLVMISWQRPEGLNFLKVILSEGRPITSLLGGPKFKSI